MTLADELVKKWQHVLDQCKIPTWTEPHCLAYCAEVASKSTVMVEVGTYVGASAQVMLRANPALHLWCVDHFQAFAFNKEICAMMLREEIEQGRCELIQAQSDIAGEMLQHMGGKIDGVWIDDGHATEDVKRDIRSFLPLVKSGGELFGHDFDIPHNDVAFGVIQSLPSYEIKVPRLWSYIKP